MVINMLDKLDAQPTWIRFIGGGDNLVCIWTKEESDIHTNEKSLLRDNPSNVSSRVIGGVKQYCAPYYVTRTILTRTPWQKVHFAK